jgi:uncharacterized membrane protein YGL010W
MKAVDRWFSEYGESHQNPINKKIHWICVPAITACVIAFFWDLPRPALMVQVPALNWGIVLVVISLLYYLRLSITLAMGMAIFSVAIIAGIVAYEGLRLTPVYQLALAIFVVAWIGQFIGHTIEGKKPSFFQDIQFLLIGPIWLLGFIYRKIGIPY